LANAPGVRASEHLGVHRPPYRGDLIFDRILNDTIELLHPQVIPVSTRRRQAINMAWRSGRSFMGKTGADLLLYPDTSAAFPLQGTTPITGLSTTSYAWPNQHLNSLFEQRIPPLQYSFNLIIGTWTLATLARPSRASAKCGHLPHNCRMPGEDGMDGHHQLSTPRRQFRHPCCR
jgi:hypothetical protein